MEFLNYSSSYLVYRNHSTASGLVLMSCDHTGLVLMSCAAYLADAFSDVLSPWCRYLT